MATDAEIIATEDKTEVKETRQSAIAAAVATADAIDSGKGDEQKTETAKKAPAKVSEKETKVEESDEDATIAEQGKQLMLALKDPAKAPIVIKFLAEQAGYTKSEIKAAGGSETKTQELTDDILSIIKAEMGEEFDVISERMAKALNKILPQQLEKAQSDIRAKFAEQETEKLRGQSASVITKLTEDFFGNSEELPDEVSKEMSKFMDRVSPSPNSDIKEYVGDAFHFAIGKLGLQKVDKKSAEKIQRNRSDASSRLASVRVPSSDSLRKDNSKPMTRQEAIQAAIEAVGKEE
jgi:hypothetical protein